MPVIKPIAARMMPRRLVRLYTNDRLVSVLTTGPPSLLKKIRFSFFGIKLGSVENRVKWKLEAINNLHSNKVFDKRGGIPQPALR